VGTTPVLPQNDMTTHTEFTALVTADRDRQDNFKTLLSCACFRGRCVRVHAISAGGVPNLARISFSAGSARIPRGGLFALHPRRWRRRTRS
jgi:hypothetical protein